MKKYSWKTDSLFQLTASFLCLAALVFLLFQAVSANLESVWTSIRLAPAFALLQGVPLNSTPNTAPWVMVGYGPLYPFAYLPATLGSSPVSAVWIGSVLALSFILIPVALISQMVSRSEAAGALNLPWQHITFTLLFSMIAFLNPSLHYVIQNIHVDAPGLGLMLMAAYFMLQSLFKGDSNNCRHCALSGIASGMSLCCKLNILPSVFALAIFAFLFLPKRNVVLFAVCVVASVGCIYGVSAWINGFDAILLNIKVLGRFPWSKVNLTSSGINFTDTFVYDWGGKFKIMVKLASDYMTAYGFGIVFSLLCLGRLADSNVVKVKMQPFVWKLGLLFLLIAVFLFPASMASFAKYGGDVNSRALFVLPLTLACFFLAIVVGLKGELLPRCLFYSSWIVLPFLAVIPNSGFAFRVNTTEPSLLEQDYNMVKSNPGQYYFPFDPLAHVMAEHCVRPSIDPVYSYAVAKMPVSKEAFRNVLPQDLRYLVVDSNFSFWGKSELERLLPEFKNAVIVPSLSKHLVLTPDIPNGVIFPKLREP